MSVSVPVNESWRYCPKCGSGRMPAGRHPFSCSECGYAHYFSPFAAVGALIVDAKGLMLFIERAKDPGKGKLGLPGGFVDAGETAESSLIREVFEEVGLDVVKYEYLASFPNKYDFAGVVSRCLTCFMSHRWSRSSHRAQEGEVSGWKFLLSQEVTEDSLAFVTHAQALNAFHQSNSTNNGVD